MSAAMASKKKGGRGDEFKQEDILQAVVIADSFDARFAPISRKTPLALMPLVNLPLIDYTLELLSASGIEYIIVICCDHVEQIKTHVTASKWGQQGGAVEVQVAAFEACMSTGDVLRELDARSLVSGDFVLVNANIVGNVQLAPIISRHRERRLKEKNAVMTMVFVRLSPGHRTRCDDDDAVICLQRSTSRLLSYDSLSQRSRLSLPLAMLQEHRDVQLRYDLLDSSVSVCSQHLLSLFTDNFDYQTRDDFIRGILVSEEISGCVITIEVLEDEYVAQVSCPQMYDSISKDVMARWTYPMVADSNMSNKDGGRYSVARHNIYLQADVTLARGCVLEESVVIGNGTSIGCNSYITRSVIGQNCHIGKKVTIRDAYLWDGVCVGDGCVITASVLAAAVTLQSDVSILPHCLLATKVALRAGVTLPSQTRLMSTPQSADDGFDSDDAGDDTDVVTSSYGCDAHEYRPPGDSDDDDDDHTQHFWPLHDEDEDETSEESEEEEDGDVEERMSPLPDDTNIFYEEVLRTLERALVENIDTANLILEINSLKYAYNIHMRDVNSLVSKAIFQPQLVRGAWQGKAFFTKLKLNFKRFLPLLRNYIRTLESQQDCITTLEEVALVEEAIAGVVKETLYFLYEEQVLEEDVIIKWYKNVPVEGRPAREKLRSSVSRLIEWLQEAEEESDESD